MTEKNRSLILETTLLEVPVRKSEIKTKGIDIQSKESIDDLCGQPRASGKNRREFEKTFQQTTKIC